jgi:phosphatidylserine/phosphatidylglycerophosphate/cardiolipin synthase-like enzyme
MHRPDTMIEIHRERVQDQTVDIFSGDKYTESVDGTGYSATASLDLTLDRVWFILDSHQRLWQEESDGESRDPLRHFGIDLAIFDSKIVIDSVTCIPLVTLPPATVTIPDGPRAGESRELRVGSPNLNNRSMGFDSECDVAIERSRTARNTMRFATKSFRCAINSWRSTWVCPSTSLKGHWRKAARY